MKYGKESLHLKGWNWIIFDIFAWYMNEMIDWFLINVVDQFPSFLFSTV